MGIKKVIDYFRNSLETNNYLLIFVIVLFIFIQVLVEYLMGRLPICKCGYVLLWYNNANGSGNSQHLFDWYSFSHFIHGAIFYFFFWLVAKRLPVRTRLLFAVLLECSWELLENSPFIINRYRTATFALDYYGDSILNSVSDVFCMILGFLFTRKFPTWLTISLVIFLELFAVYMVRDNLTLNVITLIHPIESIKHWQAAAPTLRDLNFFLFRR